VPRPTWTQRFGKFKGCVANRYLGATRLRKLFPMVIAFVGTGFVSDLYASTLKHYPELFLKGAFDANREYLSSFCERWQVSGYSSLADLLKDDTIEAVVNLTSTFIARSR
jgi:hypothetical protein